MHKGGVGARGRGVGPTPTYPCLGPAPTQPQSDAPRRGAVRWVAGGEVVGVVGVVGAVLIPTGSPQEFLGGKSGCGLQSSHVVVLVVLVVLVVVLVVLLVEEEVVVSSGGRRR